MEFAFNDGGREAAGYKGTARDCVVRALAITLNENYGYLYNLVSEAKRQDFPESGSARGGVPKKTTKRVMAMLGFKWTPTMGIGTGCKVHLATGELPSGRIIVRTSKHVVAVIDGVIHDTHDPSREGSRCVYGHWSKS